MRLDEIKGFVSNPKTNMATYDDMVKDPEYFQRRKKRKFDVVEMSPDEYIEKAVRGFSRFGNYTRSEVLATRSPELIDKYAEKMLAGEEFPTLVLDYTDEWFSQEGLHRAMAAKKIGLEKVPVMVVNSLKENIVLETEDHELSLLISSLRAKFRGRLGIEFTFAAGVNDHLRNHLFGRAKDVTREEIIDTVNRTLAEHKTTLKDIINQVRKTHGEQRRGINTDQEADGIWVWFKDYKNQLTLIFKFLFTTVVWVSIEKRDPSRFGNDNPKYRDAKILEIR